MTESIVHSLQDLPPGRSAVTIGSFDGVHRGHRYLLDRLIQAARRQGVPSIAITFDPLPAEVLRPDKAPTRLCTTEERTAYLLECGVDRVVLLEFTPDLAQQTADEFLDSVVEAAQPVAIIVGEDFAFGRDRQGTPGFLQDRASRHGYELEVVQRVNPDDLELSSSSARRALTELGDVRTAHAVLGRHYRLTGVVEDGDHRGRDLGYPTANLDLTKRITVPADGIYAGLVNGSATGDQRPALIYVGNRPTFGQDKRIVEVFLLDFSGDLYAQPISVDFLDRIRGDRRFDSPEELVAQMERDEQAGRQIFADFGIAVTVSDY